MVQADTLDCKQGIEVLEHRRDLSYTCWPRTNSRTDASESLAIEFDFPVGDANELPWDVERKPDLDFEVSHRYDNCTIGLLMRKLQVQNACASSSATLGLMIMTVEVCMQSLRACLFAQQ